MNHSSPIISGVAKLSMRNSLATCSSKNRHLLNDSTTCLQQYRPRMAGLSNAIMANVNVLSEMIDIRNGFKRDFIRCQPYYYEYHSSLKICTVIILM